MIYEEKSFAFNADNIEKAKEIMAKYPAEHKRSAIMPLLYLAQSQNAEWLSQEVIEYVAKFLQIPEIYAHEVAHFYTMFNTEPVGKFLVQVCRTTPCWLCGSDDILKTCRDFLGIDVGETTKDKKFTLIELECLGNCSNAPVMKINGRFYEKLTSAKVLDILQSL